VNQIEFDQIPEHKEKVVLWNEPNEPLTVLDRNGNKWRVGWISKDKKVKIKLP